MGKGVQHIEWIEVDYPELARNPAPVREAGRISRHRPFAEGGCYGLGDRPGAASTQNELTNGVYGGARQTKVV